MKFVPVTVMVLPMYAVVGVIDVAVGLPMTASVVPDTVATLAPFVNVNLTEFGAAVSNPMDHEILGIASAAIRTRDSEAILMPAVAPYATDAKVTVPAGIPTYGFSPYLLDPKERFMERFHGIDERVSQEALAWGVEVLYDVAMGYAGE